jgi:predicted ATPase
MNGKGLIEKLVLTNFLSYGPQGEEVELEPLNVIIGPNNSGKSNLIEAIGLLQAAPRDLTEPMRTGGGMPQWPYKGEGPSPPLDLQLEASASYPQGTMPLRHRIHLLRVGQGLELAEEVIENAEPLPGCSGCDVFYRYRAGDAVVRATAQGTGTPGSVKGRTERPLRREDLSPQQSILSQRKDPDQFPEITYLATQWERIKLYRDLNLGRRSRLRGPQAADLEVGVLRGDGGNLSLVVSHRMNQPSAKRKILDRLRKFSPQIVDIATPPESGMIDVMFHERGLFDPTPSTRMSDGTLRYLALLTILCDPSPPPLVCIEEPELGLHPDTLASVAELLLEASERTQLVVTTHSDILISGLSEAPGAVIVCERDDEGSHLQRLEPAEVDKWLEKYALGGLWRMGQIGGNP